MTNARSEPGGFTQSTLTPSLYSSPCTPSKPTPYIFTEVLDDWHDHTGEWCIWKSMKTTCKCENGKLALKLCHSLKLCHKVWLLLGFFFFYFFLKYVIVIQYFHSLCYMTNLQRILDTAPVKIGIKVTASFQNYVDTTNS